jgi:outer membrane protein assembly factor BamD
MADTLYRRELYEEAYDAYDEFERLHPKNPAVPYALYQKGMCHFSRMRSIDRDQTPARMARDEFELLLRKYPDSEYARRARRTLTECYSSLARHELFVADFYLKKRKYRAARDRYRYLLENYPDFGQYHRALENLNISIQHLEAMEDGAKSRPWWQRIIPLDSDAPGRRPDY